MYGMYCSYTSSTYELWPDFVPGRFLIYDAYDYYQPFAIETFKLPSSCDCYLGAYEITH